MGSRKENKLFEIVLSGMNENNDDMIPIIIENDDFKKIKVPGSLPVLPLRNTVLFPGVVIPISISRDKSIRLVKDVYKKNNFVGAITQKFSKIEDPKPEDLFKTGTVAQIMKIL